MIMLQELSLSEFYNVGDYHFRKVNLKNTKKFKKGGPQRR